MTAQRSVSIAALTGAGTFIVGWLLWLGVAVRRTAAAATPTLTREGSHA